MCVLLLQEYKAVRGGDENGGHVCVPFILEPNPSRPAEHVTVPGICVPWVCGQSFRPSLAPNHFWYLKRVPLGHLVARD